MPKIIFHPDVVHEIKASYEWYQDQAEGLGDDFIAELESAYEAIAELPVHGQNLVRTTVDFYLANSLSPLSIEQRIISFL